LLHAVGTGDGPTVRVLVDAGARPRATHLRAAAEAGHRDLIQFFQGLGLSIPDMDLLSLRNEMYLLLTQKNPSGALLHWQRYRARAGRNAAADMLVKISEAFLAQKDSKSADPLLLEIVREYPDQPQKMHALLRLAEISQANGSQLQAIEYYLRIADASYLKWNEASAMEGESSRSEAVKRLALYYEAQKDCDKAIYWWQRYRSSSWCGNAQAAEENWKAYKIARCKIEKGDVNEALAMLEASVLNTFEPNLPAAIYLVEYHEKNGTLDQLEPRLKSKVSDPPTGSFIPALQYIDLVRKAKKNDIHSIWAMFEGHPPGTWLQRKAMDYFVTAGSEAQHMSLEKLLTGTAEEKFWASLALGRMKVKAAVKPIVELIRTEKNIWALQHYFYGLALIGDQHGNEVIRRYAAEGSGNHPVAAKRVLEQLAAEQQKSRQSSWSFN